ncbi:shikimate dehydrogenase [Pelagicoccus sp. SDUM812002]|uniref:shikimate dehydrogenase n=1 Tax=Pelagicoccus sp. SDUM812002 TaxID=3041266 RepID=UPI00280CDE36|nr:shikimate dehydrogenase [Pelagicoccus sp. SDUM812002]MDQ8188145.1 shikimate dehydrogenase [Pelagicoccus sp. SDUM812002]
MLSYSADQTYTLTDLQEWDFPGTSLAVLGQPVRHSISPQMHNAALAHLAQAHPKLSDWRYFRFVIDPVQLVEALPLFHQKGFVGLNLTVPHKEIAFPAIEGVDPAAQAIGAVNTLRWQTKGYLGFNTDGYGLARGIKIQLGREIEGSDFVLIGAGGAARAAAIQALQSRCASLTVINRNQDRLRRLVSELAPLAAAAGISLSSLSPSDIEHLPASCLLVNATSLGLKPDDPTPIPVDRLPEKSSCFDMIYNPPSTALMKAVSAKGGQVGNGLAMLVHQGAKSLSIWTETEAPADIMQQAADKALAAH